MLSPFWSTLNSDSVWTTVLVVLFNSASRLWACVISPIAGGVVSFLSACAVFDRHPALNSSICALTFSAILLVTRSYVAAFEPEQTLWHLLWVFIVQKVFLKLRKKLCQKLCHTRVEPQLRSYCSQGMYTEIEEKTRTR